VSNLIRGVGGRSIGAVLENLHLNSFIIGSVSFLDQFLGMPCVIGKSMLMKKEDLQALGGLEAFKDILAEDFIIGREMTKAGKKVALSNYLVSNVNEYWDVKRFLNRHTRWGKLRWRIGGLKYFSEILANPVFVAALPVVAKRTIADHPFLCRAYRVDQGPGRLDHRQEHRDAAQCAQRVSTVPVHLLPRPGQRPYHRHGVVRAARERNGRLAREPVSHRQGLALIALPGDRLLVMGIPDHGRHTGAVRVKKSRSTTETLSHRKVRSLDTDLHRLFMIYLF